MKKECLELYASDFLMQDLPKLIERMVKMEKVKGYSEK